VTGAHRVGHPALRAARLGQDERAERPGTAPSARSPTAIPRCADSVKPDLITSARTGLSATVIKVARPRAAGRCATADVITGECLLVRAVIQRASEASVSVDGSVVGRLPRPGLVVLVGVTHSDTADSAATLARKVYFLRILAGEKSCADTSAPLLVISQFTLYADTSRGRRPTWQAAASRPVAEPLVQAFTGALRHLGGSVQTGVFGADMQVHLVNDGPVTLILET
jgi:D-tyrosyl-tRNA(Tyr) deacylase